MPSFLESVVVCDTILSSNDIYTCMYIHVPYVRSRYGHPKSKAMAVRLKRDT